MSLNAIITQAVNAQIEAFIQRLHKDRPKLKVEDLREVWEEISGAPIEFAHVDNPSPKKTKAKKDPNAPKKKTGYMLFSEEHRDQVKEENPDISFGQISKELGTMWKALSEKKREKYNERASVITEERKAHPEKGCSYKFSKGKKIGQKCGAPVKENGLCTQHKPKPKAKPAKVVSGSDSEPEKKKKGGKKAKVVSDSEPEKEKKGKGKISEPEKEKSVELSEEELEEEKKEDIVEKEVSEDPSEKEESEESSEEKIKDSEEESESEEEKKPEKEKKGKNNETEKEQTCMVEMKGKRKGELCGKPLGKGLSVCTYHEKQKSK